MIELIKNFIKENPEIAKQIFQLIYVPIFLIILLKKMKNKNEDTKKIDVLWLKIAIFGVVIILLYIIFNLTSFFFI